MPSKGDSNGTRALRLEHLHKFYTDDQIMAMDPTKKITVMLLAHEMHTHGVYRCFPKYSSIISIIKEAQLEISIRRKWQK